VDDNVMSISPQRGKQDRPFVGVIVLLNRRKYCIPLTSPKDKFKVMKSRVDFLKIFDEGKKDFNSATKLIGVLNINNMIPVDESVISKVDLAIHDKDRLEIKQHKQLMQKQLKWCRNHVNTIENRANKVYDMVVNHPDKNRNLVKRSSKFIKLEKIADKLNEKKG
jgi:protein AbiQ